MIVCFPAIYPDELVYSWLCRYYVHSGCFYHKTALRELYCKRSDNPSKEFIGNLRPDFLRLIDTICPLDKIVLDHTMYPQYARFIPHEQKQTARYRLIYDNVDAHHLFCVLPRNEDEQCLYYCPLCVKEDRDTYGEAYWHRIHQIRNIGICTKHSCRLIGSGVTSKSEQSYIFCPAELYVSQDGIVEEKRADVIRFADFLERVFSAPIDYESDIPVCSVLYDGLSRTKYMKPSGMGRYTKRLTDDMNVFYTSIDLCSIASIYQVQRVLIGDRYDFSVVCQIAYFIGMTPNELTCPSVSAEQLDREQASHYIRNKPPKNWEQFDEEHAPMLENTLRGVYYGTGSESGRPERISEKYVYRLLGLSWGCLENLPECKAIFERYTESYPESWARKIVWAYRVLSERGEPFYWSDIRLLSGVKKKNFPLVRPYLSKYADSVTVEQIVALVTHQS